MTETVSNDAVTDRWIPFEAGFNFRDLGGYPTRDGRTLRRGRLFRADALHRLTEADLAVLSGLELRTVVDLRSGAEIDDYGRLHVDACQALAWHHVPMMDVVVLRPKSLDELDEPAPPPEVLHPGEPYVRLLASGEAATHVISLLAKEGALPGVFHCTAGRDRTGMVAAMTLDLMGVPDELIAEDYVLTNEARGRSDAWVQENEPTFAAYLAQFTPDRRITRPEVILGFLQGLRAKYGSVEALLRDRGVTDIEIRRLRDDLLG
jgi:protein tyrosine/serine phosphatase